MSTQIQTQFTPTYSLQFAVLEENPLARPQQYTAYDFGYQIDEEEVGALMAAEYSNGSFDNPTLHIDAGEFETINHWFFS